MVQLNENSSAKKINYCKILKTLCLSIYMGLTLYLVYNDMKLEHAVDSLQTELAHFQHRYNITSTALQSKYDALQSKYDAVFASHIKAIIRLAAKTPQTGIYHKLLEEYPQYANIPTK